MRVIRGDACHDPGTDGITPDIDGGAAHVQDAVDTEDHTDGGDWQRQVAKQQSQQKKCGPEIRNRGTKTKGS